MVRFELLINGEKVSVAGIEGYGVLSAILSYVKRNPEKHDAQKHPSLEEYLEEELSLSLGGLDANNPEVDKHIEWVRKSLKVGDEIVFRILPPGEVDPAGER